MPIPRPEYPRPQFVRHDWLNLNGQWQFEFDNSDSGLERGLKDRDLSSEITVPFCPECTLSGIGDTDFHLAVWYRKIVKIPADWAGRRTLLHFQAVDYDATIWLNGVEVARHRGSSTPITCDLHGVAKPGEDATIVVRARDDWRNPAPRGKQSQLYKNHTCLYTRTTGIWQTVWMEPVPVEVSLRRTRITPDFANGVIRLEQPLTNNRPGYALRATLSSGKDVVATATVAAHLDLSPRLDLAIPQGKRRPWSTEDPFLYGLKIELLDAGGTVVDTFDSYAGLRSVAIVGKAINLNGKTLFQRLVLDQGYYADGLLTAPSDAALKKDIELGIAAGFNGARLHQKVFEERFLHHCDTMGYIVWGEFPDWGCGGYGPRNSHQKPSATYVSQWVEELERDYSHPSIVGWCPLNETWQDHNDRVTDLDEVTAAMYAATKMVDPTRPVIDASGYAHRVANLDVFDSHDYEQDPEKFAKNHAGLGEGKPFTNENYLVKWNGYNGQPYMVSEFGGIWWNPAAKPGDDSWGYGERPKSIEEWYMRFEKLCAVLLDDPNMFGYCYTQLTDVFQEQNGIYLFDRSGKFDLERVRKAQVRRAAIEKD